MKQLLPVVLSHERHQRMRESRKTSSQEKIATKRMDQILSTSPKRKRGQTSDPLIIERFRREKAVVYYTVLQSLVPNLFPKATRAKIIDETTNYIRHLEGELEFLKKQQEVQVMPVQPIVLTQHNRISTVKVMVSRNMTVFDMFFGSRTGLLSDVLQVFMVHLADVLMTTIASDSGITHITVTAHVSESGALERIKANLMLF